MPIAEARVDVFVAALVALFEPWGSPTTTKTHSPDGTWDVALTAQSVPAPASGGVVGNQLVLHMAPNFMTWHSDAHGWSKDTAGDGTQFKASVALPVGCDPKQVTAHVHDFPQPYKLTIDLVPMRAGIHGRAAG